MPIRVTLLYFGQAREEAGSAREELWFPPGSSIASVMKEVASRHPSIRKLLSSAQVAVNEEVVSADSRLREGDVVAILPPVAGG